MPKLPNHLQAIPLKTVFLLDGTGAAFSAIWLIGLLRSFPGFFGMPREIVTPLGLAAACFAVYAFSCYLFAKHNLRKLLIPLLIVNTAYCLITALLVVYFFPQLSGWGLAYFVIEMLLIAVLVYTEWKIVNRPSSTGSCICL